MSQRLQRTAHKHTIKVGLILRKTRPRQRKKKKYNTKKTTMRKRDEMEGGVGGDANKPNQGHTLCNNSPRRETLGPGIHSTSCYLPVTSLYFSCQITMRKE